MAMDDKGRLQFCYCSKCREIDLEQSGSWQSFNEFPDKSGHFNEETSLDGTSWPRNTSASRDTSLYTNAIAPKRSYAPINRVSSNDNAIKKRKLRIGKLHPTKVIAHLDEALQSDPTFSVEFKLESSKILGQLKQRIDAEERRKRFELAISAPRLQNRNSSLPAHITLATPSPFDNASSTSIRDSAYHTEVAASSCSIPDSTTSGTQSIRATVIEGVPTGRRGLSLYQCTYPNCDSDFQTKPDWKRHEESGEHWPQERYMCLACPISMTDSEGTLLCIFCWAAFESLEEVRAHNLECAFAQWKGRTFGRKDHFRRHLRDSHRLPNQNGLLSTWSYPIESPWPRQCGFCGIYFETWDQRANHIEDHFKEGLRVTSWMLPFPAVRSLKVREIKTHRKDDKEDEDDGHEGHYRGHFATMVQPGLQPNASTSNNQVEFLDPCYISYSTASGTIFVQFDKTLPEFKVRSKAPSILHDGFRSLQQRLESGQGLSPAVSVPPGLSPSPINHESKRDKTAEISPRIDFDISASSKNILSGFLARKPVDESKYEHLVVLGRGDSSWVDEVLHIPTLTSMVRKTINLRHLKTSPLPKIQQELQQLKELQKWVHPHVIRVMDIFLTHDSLSLITLPVAQCSLHFFMSRMGHSVDMVSRLSNWFSCLASAIDFLHSHGIEHQDIRPSNILVRGWRVFLSDFGISHVFKNNISFKIGVSRVQKYRAPEIVCHGENGLPSDVFALGCVFAEMSTVLAGKTLDDLSHYLESASEDFSGSTPYHVNLSALSSWLKGIGQRVDGTADWPSAGHVETVNSMLCASPEKRPTARALTQQYTQFDCCTRNSYDERQLFEDVSLPTSDAIMAGLLDIDTDVTSVSKSTVVPSSNRRVDICYSHPGKELISLMPHLAEGTSLLEDYLQDHQRHEYLAYRLGLASPLARSAYGEPSPKQWQGRLVCKQRWPRMAPSTEAFKRGSPAPNAHRIKPFDCKTQSKASTASASAFQSNVSSESRSKLAPTSISSVQSSATQISKIQQSKWTTNELVPPLHEWELPCEFKYLGCEMSFKSKHFELWVSHSITHFGHHPPPDHATCVFCGDSFADLPHGPHENWRKRMVHIRNHFAEGFTEDYLQPDFHVIGHMADHNLLTSEDLAFAMKVLNVHDESELIPFRTLDTEPILANYRLAVQLIQDLAAKLEVIPPEECPQKVE